MAEYTDKIQLRDLRAACIIGVGPEERSSSQEVRIDLSLEVDLEPAGRSDRLEDTVDYGALAREVVAMVEGSSFQLLEKLAASHVGVLVEAFITGGWVPDASYIIRSRRHDISPIRRPSHSRSEPMKFFK